ncbi:hypothetical protein OQA88_9232 [Cercophora sp. LCS_1]
MPSATIDSHGVEAVASVRDFLDQVLSRADSVKQTASVEPPLLESDLGDFRSQLASILGPPSGPNEAGVDPKKVQRFAIIETAARDTFSYLIGAIPIEDPEFAKVWNLFDILSILSDSELCDPALLFWLVEELLDSQTIAGCRKVFDFLESRRERITAKHFKSKQLVILRTCNELLRRLSRALDPAFCGRVFIFMFQSFPLGDKSSVNLRGEYHVENATIFDREPPGDGADKMDVDTEDKSSKSNDGRKQPDKSIDPDSLYPIFWSLQESFSQPKKLFDSAHFSSFKTGLEATMAAFRSIKPEQASRSKEKLDKQVEENSESLKRKRSDDEDEDELAGSFNPKYLTSRDLFKLEVSDLAFRRNILVQALIIMDFLISLSPKAKEKLSTVKVQNKSVSYSDIVLSEEDTKWATDMKASISDYLKQGFEGPYFFRMVDTVLSRDKNWVRWKIENCPPIELPPVSAETFRDAKRVAGKLAASKRLRSTPLGALSLDFLDDGDEASSMERFKVSERYSLPELESFKRGIADDDFEIEMPTNNQTKAEAIEAKSSKTWRALRIASKFKLSVFDNIDSDDKIDAIFEENIDPDLEETQDTGVEDAVFPDDRRPIVIVDAVDRKSKLLAELLRQHPGTFTKVPAHVVRKPEEGEASGKDYHLVDLQKFNMMRDGDQFIAFTEDGDNSRGTTRRSVDAISEVGKVPVLEMDRDSAQQVKDNGFDARFIFISPPEGEALDAQLKETGLADEKLQEALKTAAELAEHATGSGFYDSIVVSEAKLLEATIFGATTNGTEDVAMEDAAK